jgi:hypothetical protein
MNPLVYFQILALATPGHDQTAAEESLKRHVRLWDITTQEARHKDIVRNADRDVNDKKLTTETIIFPKFAHDCLEYKPYKTETALLRYLIFADVGHEVIQKTPLDKRFCRLPLADGAGHMSFAKSSEPLQSGPELLREIKKYAVSQPALPHEPDIMIALPVLQTYKAMGGASLRLQTSADGIQAYCNSSSHIEMNGGLRTYIEKKPHYDFMIPASERCLWWTTDNKDIISAAGQCGPDDYTTESFPPCIQYEGTFEDISE